MHELDSAVRNVTGDKVTEDNRLALYENIVASIDRAVVAYQKYLDLGKDMTAYHKAITDADPDADLDNYPEPAPVSEELRALRDEINIKVQSMQAEREQKRLAAEAEQRSKQKGEEFANAEGCGVWRWADKDFLKNLYRAGEGAR